jgi:pilus assembly protein Flp/PilA
MLVKLTRRVGNFLKREDGPTAVEYAIMLALIIVVCIAAIQNIGNQVDETAENVTAALRSGS